MPKDKKEVKETGLSTKVSEEALAILKDLYPTEPTYNRALLPRLGLVSQDVTEEVKNPTTKKKEIKVITEAGTFFLERQSDEEEEVEDDEGKMVKRKKWEKTELGEGMEGIILFKRKQLRYYDETKEEYTSSPVYDTDDEIIPLFRDKKEVDRGTPKELKARKKYQITKDGKTKSKLEDNRILYVLYEGEIYQLNLRGTSMYAFMTYERKTIIPSVLTSFGSIAKENGAISWNQMTFEVKRPLTAKEVEDVITRVGDIKRGIAQEKEFYASKAAADDASKESGADDEDDEDEEEDDF